MTNQAGVSGIQRNCGTKTNFQVRLQILATYFVPKLIFIDQNSLFQCCDAILLILNASLGVLTRFHFRLLEPDDSVVFDLTKNGESSSKYYVSIESEVVISSLKILTAISRAPTSASELRIEITKPLVVKTLEVSGFYTSVVLNSTLKAQTRTLHSVKKRIHETCYI